MLYNVLYALSLVLMLLGLMLFFYVLINKCLCFGAERNFFTVIAGYEEKENLPDEIYSAFSQMSLFNFGTHPPVIVVDFNLSDETKIRCRIMTESFGKLIFCKAEELSEIIGDNLYLND